MSIKKCILGEIGNPVPPYFPSDLVSVTQSGAYFQQLN